jgi:hypothetical protein
MGLATTFMCTSFSIYISKLIPKIDVASFAWRWLVIAGFFSALVVAAAIDRLRENTGIAREWMWVYRGATCAAILFSLWITAYAVVGRALSQPGLNPPASFLEAGFTPKGSTDPHSLADTPRVVIEPEDRASEITVWEPYHREVQVNVREPSRVRLKTYNFPGWVARVDGASAPMLSDKDGVQIVEVPEGVHRIEATFVNTPPRTAGAILSLLGFLGVVGLASADRIRRSSSATGRAPSGLAPFPAMLKAVAPFVAPFLIGAVMLFWLSSRGNSGGAPAGGGDAPAATAADAAKSRQAESANMQGSVTLHVGGVPSLLVAVDE